MKVLVACERSHRIASAFQAKGHDAYSCDVLPCEITTPFHIQDDVLNHLEDGWDLMIAHPPCQYLCCRSQYWKSLGKHTQEDEDKALEFFIQLDSANIPKKAIENPIGIIPRKYRKYSQIIEPFMFGEPVRKCICLWLTNLPLLNPTMALWELEKYHHIDRSGRKRYWYDATIGSKTKDRAYRRAKTSLLVAQAMAEQWG